MNQDDLLMAFFPCVRFENQIMLWFRGECNSQKNWDDIQKMEYCIKIMKELEEMYELVNKLFIICKRKNLKIVMENPFSEEHFLRRYWCIKPSVIDRDRREKGDYFAKPTQYWFFNCAPKNNFVFEMSNDNAIKIKNAVTCIPSGASVGVKKLKTARSMIHPEYANRFIREFLIDYETEF